MQKWCVSIRVILGEEEGEQRKEVMALAAHKENNYQCSAALMKVTQ